MNYAQRIEREDEGDRIRAMLAREASESDARIRAAFHDAASGLIAWKDSPELTPRAYRRLEAVPNVYRPYDPQGDVEPFDIDADWSERA